MASWYLELISNIFGCTQMALWTTGMSFAIIECIKQKTSSGLSIDYILLNQFGFICMALQDQFGFWVENSSYHMEVHITDQMLSLIGCLFSTFGCVINMTLPSKGKNRVSWISLLPNGIALVIIVIVFSSNSMDNTMVTAGLAKAILSQFSYMPQYQLIYRNQTTYGWSMEGVWADFVGSTVATVQVCLDYWVFGRGEGFWHELNCGKFALNFLSQLCCLIFFLQHYVIYAKNNNLIATGQKKPYEIIGKKQH